MSDTFLAESIALLERSPAALDALLRGLPEPWITATEGPGTWCPFDVLGHLVHGEHGDWLTRLHRILEHGTSVPFDKFDREAMFHESVGKTMDGLLDEFAMLRRKNLEELRAMDLQPAQLALVGMHPSLGEVTARQLIGAWTAHDMTHVVQIARVMGKRYNEACGPWAQFMSVMK
ncbi:hypothetical protein Terro_0014 [Terriglobus roseus DSM 18391]|uniref:DinB-like domain-containing protein n=1 Tax=Terriglobus roseus (strain DSM 18391 / NRRL B-41598 / KBS 63) TaxID=926566 RepID=I3ZAU8_TERRK|nr:DinB family protein [Terriglobus roseus]AFL86366.1 hypothetical protein Terro_0014 [Terriglobus roseus DSM 18391]